MILFCTFSQTRIWVALGVAAGGTKSMCPSRRVKNLRKKVLPFSSNKQTADSLPFWPFLAALELLEKSEVETNNVLGEDDAITLNRVCDVLWGYSISIFLRSLRVTFEWRGKLFTCTVMPTLNVALLTKACRGQSTAIMLSDRKLEDQSYVEFNFQARRNWAWAGMVEWNRIIRLFRFSRILGQPREELPKYRCKISENVCSILPPTQNFHNISSNGKRLLFPMHPHVQGNKTPLKFQCAIHALSKMACFNWL